MTAPPAGALEACLALLVEQMDMLHDDFVSYSDGKPTVPFVVLRDALVAALNAYDEARPALLAALRLREADGFVLVPVDATISMFRGMVEWAEDEGEITDEYLQANLPDFQKGYAAMIAASPTADDLARVLEEGE